jgi:hypothetical protein
MKKVFKMGFREMDYEAEDEIDSQMSVVELCKF